MTSNATQLLGESCDVYPLCPDQLDYHKTGRATIVRREDVDANIYFRDNKNKLEFSYRSISSITYVWFELGLTSHQHRKVIRRRVHNRWRFRFVLKFSFVSITFLSLRQFKDCSNRYVYLSKSCSET